MKLKNIKIGLQLLIGFIIILLLVIVLGTVSYRQTQQVHEQTRIMYEHPLKVRRAVGALNTNIQQMRLGTRDLLLAVNEDERHDAIQLIEISSADASRQFTIIFDAYLGPKNDVEEAYQAFIAWKNEREINTKLGLEGNVAAVKESISVTGKVGKLRDVMLIKINKIDNFAEKKGDTLHEYSVELKKTLSYKLILFISVIIIITLIIYFLLLYTIRKPLVTLTKITRRFDEGELSARCDYESENEIGMLSASFNSLAGNIEATSMLNIQTGLLSDMMLIEDDAQRFFQITLQILMEDTGSHMVAVYLLSEDRKSFEHFESIGLDDNAKKSFSAKGLEGEIGIAITTKKIQHLKDIPDNSRFKFNTAGGKFIPREIITIPILSGNDVIAVISLASLHHYSELALQLIYKIHLTYCARIDKILTYQKLRIFSDTLAYQNRELEAQKMELTSQSTELTEQNRELELQKQQLSEANRLKTSFLSNMSHELRTPLNSVIALSGVLNRHLKGQIPEEEYSYLEVIERNGKNLLSLINNILDIARIESGREEIEISEISICDCINEVVEMLQPQAHTKKIKIKKASGNCEVLIKSDGHKIVHILQNLIANAVKFTEKGEVTIAVEKSDDHVIISITDSGIGISEEHLPHIFDEFRQADGGTSRRYGGTGLGLSIAKKYAHLLGGVINVKSEINKGSEFTLTLPLIYQEDNIIIDDIVPYGYEISSINLSSDNSFLNLPKTILLVEDSEPAIIQLKDFLEESGYQILVAHDGKEGLKIMSEIIPDAIILDLMMPDIDGFEVLETIRNADSTAHTPVLILTAKHITKDELKFLKRNNIYQLIQKGDVNKVQLLNAVNGMVSPAKKVDSIHGPTHEQPTTNQLNTKHNLPDILLVEDNLDNMIAAKANMDGKFNVIEAYDGPEGIAKAIQFMPDLILMDISLPGMDGIEAFKTIRKEASLHHVPVIALTASALTEDREAILSQGFDAFLAKPIDETTFFKTINDLLYGK
jgi:signal transduction histidine kinase/CheY-like chemotaxis protein/HAMP domain-containing protein